MNWIVFILTSVSRCYLTRTSRVVSLSFYRYCLMTLNWGTIMYDIPNNIKITNWIISESEIESFQNLKFNHFSFSKVYLYKMYTEVVLYWVVLCCTREGRNLWQCGGHQAELYNSENICNLKQSREMVLFMRMLEY